MKEGRWDFGEERREMGVGSWRREMEMEMEMEREMQMEMQMGEKRKTTNWTIQRKAIKKWADRGLLKNTFRHQEAYKMSPKTSHTGSFDFLLSQVSHTTV